MGRFDAEIDKYFPGDIHSRAIAQAFVERFEGQPFAERAIPAMLQEGAAVNARILAGELSPQAGRELLTSLATEGYGLPAHVVAEGRAWLDDVGADLAEQGIVPQDAEPQTADVSGPRSDLITKLFAPQDRAAAAALAKALDAHPQSASRTEALLHEISLTADIQPQPAYDSI